MDEERNFRLSYYEKVGFKTIDEDIKNNKSLELIIDTNETYIDLDKLRTFCHKYSVPETHKYLVWKLLLDVMPYSVKCQEFVFNQQKETYRNLVLALGVLQQSLETSPTRLKTFLSVWLLHTNEPRSKDEENSAIRSSSKVRIFGTIVRTVMYYYQRDEDIYWVSKAFYDKVIVKTVEKHCSELILQTVIMLERLEDDGQLYQHLVNIEADVNSLPMQDWYVCCFAGVLQDGALGRIWDKLCCGDYKILSCVSVALLITLRSELFKCDGIRAVLHVIKTTVYVNPIIQGEPINTVD